jgi:YegS/Rv2252/BmrU family lipid kinase
VLPLGTANDFARTLDLPRSLEEACATVAHGKVVDVDLGRADGRPFLNVASLGLSVGVTRALGPAMKRWLGPAAYPVATLAAYRRHEPFRARLTFPDGDFEPIELDDLLQVAVGNGRHYGGGNTIAPDAGIDDHTLHVYAITRGRLRDHVSLARLLRSGSFIDHQQVQQLATRAIEVTTYDGQPVNLDGEIAATTPVRFEVQRNAFDVVVPQHVTHVRPDDGASAASS